MLQDVLAAVTIPGLPDWVGLVLMLLLLLVGLAYLLMPFSVFGLKGRLDAIEVQLDEIQTELRGIALRLPDPGRRRPPLEEDWAEPIPAGRPAAEATPPRHGPPIPPPPAWPDRTVDRPGDRPGNRTLDRDRGHERGPGPGRAEPRLDWPRPPR